MSAPQGPTGYQYQNQPGADKAAYSATQGITQSPNYGGQAVSGIGASLASLGGNAGYNPAQTVQYGNAESNMGASLSPAVYALLNQGFDPQSALYNRSAQQLQEQVRAGQSARGVANSPYGAGGESDAMSNFNIDWQNNLLNRETQAAGAAGGLATQGGNLINQGQTLAQSAPALQTQLFSQMAQASPAAYAQQQQQITDFLNYLSGGTSATDAATNAFSAQQKSNSGFFGGIGSGIGTMLSFL